MINLNKKYAPLIANDHTRYFLISGGRGSSKSFSINSLLCMMMLESRRNILFLRKTLTSAHLSIIPEFLEKLELLGLKDMFHITKTEIVNKSNGATIYFRGMQSSSSDNTANLKSLNGISILVIDEAEELSQEEVFDRIDLSVRQQGAVNKVIIALNPTTTEHWIYRRFFEDTGVQQGFNGVKGNTTYIHTDYRDNIKHLSESFIQQVENIKNTNPKKYEHTILGGWLAKAEGVVFTNWKIGKFEDNGRNIFGQDYGFSVDPTTLIQVSINKPLKKIYVKELVYKSGLTTSEIASLNQRYAGESLIIGDSAEPRLIEELKQQGCNIIPAVKGPGSVSVGISLIQDYEVIIDPDSTNIIKEFNNYVWSNKKSSTPIDDYNHCFVGSTMVTTSNGETPIRAINEGEKVLTSEGFKKVLKVFRNGLKRVKTYQITVNNTEIKITGTPTHKVKSSQGEWKQLQELEMGDMINIINPKGAIESHTITLISSKESGDKEVYDIMVEDTHEYFANGILVHNCIDPLRYVCTHELSSKAEVFFF